MRICHHRDGQTDRRTDIVTARAPVGARNVYVPRVELCVGEELPRLPPGATNHEALVLYKKITTLEVWK